MAGEQKKVGERRWPCRGEGGRENTCFGSPKRLPHTLHASPAHHLLQAHSLYVYAHRDTARERAANIFFWGVFRLHVVNTKTHATHAARVARTCRSRHNIPCICAHTVAAVGQAAASTPRSTSKVDVVFLVHHQNACHVRTTHAAHPSDGPQTPTAYIYIVSADGRLGARAKGG